MRDSPVIKEASLSKDASAYLLVNTIRLPSFFCHTLRSTIHDITENI